MRKRGKTTQTFNYQTSLVKSDTRGYFIRDSGVLVQLNFPCLLLAHRRGAGRERAEEWRCVCREGKGDEFPTHKIQRGRLPSLHSANNLIAPSFLYTINTCAYMYTPYSTPREITERRTWAVIFFFLLKTLGFSLYIFLSYLFPVEPYFCLDCGKKKSGFAMMFFSVPIR